MKTDEMKIAPKWSQSKETVWTAVFEHLEDTPPAIERISPKRTAWLYAVASIAAIIILIPCIAFLYTKSEVAARGSHLAVMLPDGSKVELNAESQLEYKPLWWFISRNVKLKGEAFFEVTKGGAFNVQADPYTVSVLGTSFNIYYRAEKFNVTCLTGKVVVSTPSDSVTLTSNMQAIAYQKKLSTKNVSDAQESIQWKQGKFVFVGVPLQEVIREIERQYNIEVWASSDLDYSYSGHFTKTNDPNDVLKIVGTPFGIELKKK